MFVTRSMVLFGSDHCSGGHLRRRLKVKTFYMEYKKGKPLYSSEQHGYAMLDEKKNKSFTKKFMSFDNRLTPCVLFLMPVIKNMKEVLSI